MMISEAGGVPCVACYAQSAGHCQVLGQYLQEPLHYVVFTPHVTESQHSDWLYVEITTVCSVLIVITFS